MLLVQIIRLLTCSFSKCMILGGSSGMSFSKRSELTAGTSIFYDLFQKDQIGHKIISTIVCENLNKEQTLVFMKKKMREIVDKYPYFGSRIVNYSWRSMDIDYDNMVLYVEESRDSIVKKILNEPFDENLPGWQVIISSNNCILFVCDHIYGDGAFIANVVRILFDNKSLNNLPLPREKRSLSIFSKIFLFFKIIYIIYYRFQLEKSHPAPWADEETSQVCLAKLPLIELKKIRDRFSCSNGSHISINDIIHTIIVKANREYLNKNIISSAAMFNMRNGDYFEENKLGYILLTNKLETNALPEETLKDVNEFMQFYKETPATHIISKCMHWYYTWDNVKACNLLRTLNRSVDFIISNYMFQYKDKHIQQGVKIINAYGTVTPCDASQMYSISTYGDIVNIYLTYKKSKIRDIKKMQTKFDDAMNWIKS